MSLLLPQLLQAQYRSGDGDGHNMSVSGIQLATYDQTAIYGGSDGDGHDMTPAIMQLITYDQGSIYGGGDGDGHDMAPAIMQLMTFDQFAIYGGGEDDGHDMTGVTMQLLTFDEFAIYGGGEGDGYDMTGALKQLFTFSQASIYGGGEGDGHGSMLGLSGALPLALITFEAIPHETFVLLKWVTEDERDTDFFTIERTTNGNHFTTVGTADAAGNSEPGESLHYQLTDTNPAAGTSYYRVKTTDFDGNLSLSSLAEVTYEPFISDWDYLVYPNPNNGRAINVQTSGTPGEILTVNLTDAGGKRVLTRTFGAVGGGELGPATHTLHLDHRLPAGAYVMRVQGSQQKVRNKMIVVQ